MTGKREAKGRQRGGSKKEAKIEKVKKRRKVNPSEAKGETAVVNSSELDKVRVVAFRDRINIKAIFPIKPVYSQVNFSPSLKRESKGGLASLM